MTTTPDIPADLGEAGRYAGTYNESLRLARRFLPIVLLLMAIASASLVVGIVMEFGVWTHEEVIHGPFRTETGSRDAWVPVGQAFSNFSCCVGARPDDAQHSTASSLRAWLNGRELGPAHMLHADIRSGKAAGFSHWQDNTIRFFIPEAVTNDQTAVLRVRYPVQYSIGLLSLNELIFVALAVLAGFCGVAARMLSALHVSFRAGIVTSAAILPVYIAFLITGYVTQQPLPATYVFYYLAIDSLLNGFQPYLPHVLILFAILLVGLNWSSGLDAGLQGTARQQELQTVNLWRRLGFFSTAGLFYVFVAASAWSGHVSAQDVLEMNIGGLVPFSDAAGYFGGGLNYLISGQIDPWNLRRPLAALFRSETIALGGLDYVGTLLVQIAALSFAIYWATNAIMKWRGVAAGLVFWAMAFILFRPFAITTMTEPLALFWSFCSIPFFICGLQRESVPHLLVGMAFLFVALFIRMGAMFVMPFMVLWAILCWGADIRQRVRNACAVSAILLTVLLGNVAIEKIYGQPGAEIGGNFASTLCGMSIGGYWSDCAARYAGELEQKGEAQQAAVFYRATLQNVLHDPRTFVRSMRNALISYRNDLTSLPTTGYRWSERSQFLSFALYFVSFLGWFYALRKNRNTTAVTFAVFVGLGILSSVPFVYQSDPRRVLYATNPLLLLVIAGGFFAPAAFRRQDDSLKWQAGSILLPVAAVTAMLLPFVLRTTGVSKPNLALASELRPNQQIIAGYSTQTGFVVLPDSAQPLPDVPSMTIGKLREFITANRQIPSKVVQLFPEPPFALVYPRELVRQDGYAYFLPAEIFRDKKTETWKMTVTPLSPGFGFFLTSDVTPMKQ